MIAASAHSGHGATAKHADVVVIFALLYDEHRD
jgi:hypothetical protein